MREGAKNYAQGVACDAMLAKFRQHYARELAMLTDAERAQVHAKLDIQAVRVLFRRCSACMRASALTPYVLEPALSPHIRPALCPPVASCPPVVSCPPGGFVPPGGVVPLSRFMPSGGVVPPGGFGPSIGIGQHSESDPCSPLVYCAFPLA